MKKMLKSSGQVCPFLSRRLTYLMLLLVSLFGGGSSAWAQSEICSAYLSASSGSPNVNSCTLTFYSDEGKATSVPSGTQQDSYYQSKIDNDKNFYVIKATNAFAPGDQIIVYLYANSATQAYKVGKNAKTEVSERNPVGSVYPVEHILASNEIEADGSIRIYRSSSNTYFAGIKVLGLGSIKTIDGTTTTWDFAGITETMRQSMSSLSPAWTLNADNKTANNPQTQEATYWAPSWCNGIRIGSNGKIDASKANIIISKGFSLGGGAASMKVTIPAGANTLTVTSAVPIISNTSGVIFSLKDGETNVYVATVTPESEVEIHRSGNNTGSITNVKTTYTELPAGPTATFLYGTNASTGTQWENPTEAMTITIPAHKAGQNFNVTVTPEDGATLGTITGGSKNGNVVSFTAPEAGNNTPLIVTIPVTKNAVTTDYTIAVNTETALSKVTFNDKTRYSKLVINGNYTNFYANTNVSAINSSSGTLDYVPGLVAKAMIEAVDYYKDHTNTDITADQVKTWYDAVKGYGDSHSIKQQGIDGESFDDLNAVKLYFGLKNVAKNNTLSITETEATINGWNEKLSTALTAIGKANNTYVIKSSRSDSYPAISIADMQGGWWHKKGYVNQMWCDGQYMGTALLAQLINDADNYDANNEEKRVTADDWSVVTNQLKITYKYLWNDDTKLLHHAFAADNGTKNTSNMWSFDQKNGQNNYRNSAVWGRAAGWYFLALVDVLEQMKIANQTSHADYSTLLGYLDNIAAGIKARQDATTGCWYQLPLYDDTFSANDCGNGATNTRVYNYLESSSTAIFTAAFLKGIRLGLLDKATYETTAKKAYQGFIENFINSTDNKIYWCSRSAGIGTTASGAKLRNGSDAYYLKGYDVVPTKITDNGGTDETEQTTLNKGTEGKVLGAFIMAATEYERAYLDAGWTITYGSTDESRGTVTAVYTVGGAEFVSGTVVPNNTQTTFTAMPNPGYKVDMSNPWNNATSKHENPLTYAHTANRNFFAKFIPLEIPTISAQTIADATYKKNATATALSVTGATSEDGNLSYQWYSNTSNTTIGGTKIIGQTGTTFTPPTNKNVGATYYYCEVSETVNRTSQAGDKANGTAICYSDIAKITIAADDCDKDHTGTVYGAIDQTTPYRQAHTDVFELNEGEKKVFRFTNHGNSENAWNNWNVAIVSSTDLNVASDDMVFRADNYGWGTIFDDGNHSIEMNGGGINWTTFKSDMNNADVEVTIDYNGTTKKITITAKSFNGTYIETATSSETSGTKGVYFFVDQSHFCDFRELVPVRAAISNGTLNSITVNETPIASPQNNTDYFVEPNAKVVITATPNSGYYFKNWSVTGTAGKESVNGETNVYTIANINATATTVKAKYEVKSGETLPRPANSEFDGDATITLPPFGSGAAGSNQTIALNLPDFATAVVKSGSTGNIEGDNLTITAPAQGENGSTIITVTAQNGSTKDYTINYSTTTAPSYNYVVKAVTSEDVELMKITEGNASSVTVTYPQYILSGTTLYNTPQGPNEPGWYRKTLIIDAAGDQKITYNGTSVNDVVFYTEGENIQGMTATVSNTTRASNGAAGYRTDAQNVLVTTIPAGAYTISARGVNGNADARHAIFTAGELQVFDFTINNSSNNGNNSLGTSQPFYVDKETEIYVSCQGSSASGLDWFYIKKADVLPVVVNEQKFAATEAVLSSVKYATNTSTTISGETTRDGVKGKYYSLKNSNYSKGTIDKYITVTFTGALGFKVNAYHGNGSDTRHLYIKVDEEEAKDMSVTPGSCITSPIYAVTTGTHTLKIYGANADVYLANVIFLTEQPKGELTTKGVTKKVTEPASVETLASTSGGTITMTTDPTIVSEFATVSFTNNELSITPVKAGTFTLNFSIAANGAYVAGTTDYTVTIRKEKLTMTVTPDDYSWNKTTTEVQPALTQPTVVLKDEAGNAINGKTLTYVSDDPTVATVDGTTIRLAAEPQGSANVYIAFAGDDTYEAVSGIYSVLIEQGVSHKFTTSTFGANGPDVGEGKILYDVKKENGEYVDDTTKPLVYYTFGGWKYTGKDKNGNDAPHLYWIGSTSYQDAWEQPSLYSGGNGNTPTYVDGYKFASSGKTDAMDETKNPSTLDPNIQGGTIFGKARNGWFKSESNDPHVKPFTLPVRGAYIKYEPQVNGTLSVYLLQNGAFNTETGDDGKSYTKVGEFQPHAFHVVDQNGTAVPLYTDFTFVVKEPVTQRLKNGTPIICSYEGDKVTNDLDNGFVPNGVSFVEHDVATWPMFYTNYTKQERQDIKDAWSSGIMGAQKVVKLHNGSFFLTQKAYVKYTFYVAAGQTYYIFSNFSKIGMSGINFVKDENQPSESDVLALNDVSDFPTLKNASENVSKNLSIPQYGKITVNRSFTPGQWSTICLPFDMTEREVEQNFGKDTELLIYDGVEDGESEQTIHFVHHEIQSILAGYPYLIKATGTGVDLVEGKINGITVKNKMIQPKNSGSPTNQNFNYTKGKDLVTFSTDRYYTNTPYVAESVGPYTFTGTDSYSTEGKQKYYNDDIYMTGSGSLARRNGSTEYSTMKGYRAFIKSNTSSNHAKSLTIFFSGHENEDDDQTTGIEVIGEDENSEFNLNAIPVKGIYSISGQKLNSNLRSLPAGVYIVNGQKVYVK